MPKYPRADSFDLIRTIKNLQADVKALRVRDAGIVKKPLNQIAAALNTNPYFWGGDATGWAALNGTFSVVSDPPSGSPYPYTALYVNNGSVAGAVAQVTAAFPVVPLQTYMVQASVNSNVTTVQIGFDFLDSTHTVISGPTNPSITVTAGIWTNISAALEAPAGAVYAYPRVGSATGDGASTYVAGITTQVTAVAYQPGTSPAVVETWHDLPAGTNGWGLGTGGWKKYRLTYDGDLALSISLRLIGTKTDGTAIFGAGALPSGYQVSSARRLPISTSGNALSSNNTPWIGLLADGSMNISGVNTAGTLSQVDLHGVFPLI